MGKFVEFLVEKLSGPSPKEPVKAMETSGIVLVTGATGGVGRRVVDILRNKGLPVRVLVQSSASFNFFCFLEFSMSDICLCCICTFQVRNEEKARKMFGSDVDLVS